MKTQFITVDANEAAANAAYRLNEVIAIYPITPSSGMGELSDEWASVGRKNLWGTVPLVAEMQSEGGTSYSKSICDHRESWRCQETHIQYFK